MPLCRAKTELSLMQKSVFHDKKLFLCKKLKLFYQKLTRELKPKLKFFIQV